MLFKIIYWVAYIVLYPFYRFRFVGLQNIPRGGCLICGNHTANIDAVLVVLALGSKGEYAIMAKAQLFQSKLVAWALGLVRAFPVRREDNDINAIKAGLRAVKDGKKLIVFPEGTRVKDGKSAPIKSGAAMFAIKGGVPIVPVFVPIGAKAFKRNTIIFGKPFSPAVDGKPNGADYERISHEVMSLALALGAPARAGGDAS